MFRLISLLGVLVGFLNSCDNELQLLEDQSGRGNSELSINVITEQPETKELITDTYLPANNGIGLTVTNTSNGNYDGFAYNNIRFTSSGTGSDQTWSGASTIKLSATDGYCYAYYPYSSSVTDISSIPVTSGQTDFMYATKVTVNDKAKSANLIMKHALSAVTVTIKKGSYTGTGMVTACTWSSATAGTSAKLNAKTGALSSITGSSSSFDTGLTSSSSLTINTTGNSYSFVVVPTATAGKLTFNLTMDGKSYSVQSNSVTFAAGSRYNFTLIIDAKQMSVSKATVSAWTGVNSGSAGVDRVKDNPDPVFTAGGYKITYSGTKTGLSMVHTIAENEIVIETTSSLSTKGVKMVSATNCTMHQYLESSGKRTIVLTDLTGDVDISFNGTGTVSYKKSQYYSSSGYYGWTVPAGVTNIDAFIVGAGAGCCAYRESYASNLLIATGGSGYTKLYKGSKYVAPTSGTWDGSRDGNSISVEPGKSLSIYVGSGGSPGTSGANDGDPSYISNTRNGKFTANGGRGGRASQGLTQSSDSNGTYYILILNVSGGTGGSGGSASINVTSGVNGSSDGNSGNRAVGSLNYGSAKTVRTNALVGYGQSHTTNYTSSSHVTSGVGRGGAIGSKLYNYGAGGSYNGSAQKGEPGYVYFEYYTISD